MPLTIPLFAILIGILIAAACLMVLYIAACVLKNETQVWELRNEVEHLHYDYQLRLHRASSNNPNPDDIGMVDIIEDPIMPAAAAA